MHYEICAEFNVLVNIVFFIVVDGLLNNTDDIINWVSHNFFLNFHRDVLISSDFCNMLDYICI